MTGRDRIDRRGFALLQVMIIVGVAAVLGFALLAETSLQVQAGSNAELGAQADALAESGVNLAIYYLLNPWSAPALQNGYWPGGTGLVLDPSVPGRIDVSVAADGLAANEYVIRSQGKAGGSEVAHTIVARVRIEPGLKIKRAVSAKKAMTLASGAKVSGDLATNEKFTNYATVTGTAYAASFDNQGVIATMLPISASEPAGAPAPTAIQTYSSYAYSDGRVYSRSTLGSPSIGWTSLNPTASNPAGIYWSNGNLTVNSYLTVNGTLIVNGNLILNGTNISIEPQDGYPALIVLGEFRTRGSKSINIDGVTYVGKTIKPDGASSLLTTLDFDGALLFGDNGGILAGSGSTIKVNYKDSAKLILPDLDTGQMRSVAILSWEQ